MPNFCVWHSWEDTGYNAYGVAVEQRCRWCGALRHHLFRDQRGVGEAPRWRVGAHPGYRALPKEGPNHASDDL